MLAGSLALATAEAATDRQRHPRHARRRAHPGTLRRHGPGDREGAGSRVRHLRDRRHESALLARDAGGAPRGADALHLEDARAGRHRARQPGQGQQGHGPQRPVVLLPRLLRDPDRRAAAGRQEQRLRALPAPHRARVRARRARAQADRGCAGRFLGRLQVRGLAEGRRVLHERRARSGARRALDARDRPATSACGRTSCSSGKKAATTC